VRGLAAVPPGDAESHLGRFTARLVPEL
jgi:hypothetical protein